MKQILLIILLIPGFLFSQKKKDEIDEAIIAKVKSHLKDEKQFVYSSNTEIDFEFSKNPMLKGSEKIAAVSNVTQFCVPLKSGATFNDYIFYDDKSSVEEFKARTTKGKPVYLITSDEKYQSESIFYDDARYKAVQFDYGGIDNVVNYSYIKTYQDVKYLTSIYFNSDEYINEKVITFNVPDWLTMEIKEYNFKGFNIEKTVVHDDKKKLNRITFTAKNLKKLKNEDYAISSAKCMPHLLLLYKSYSESGKSVNLFNTVDDLYGWYYKIVADVVNDNSKIKPFVKELTKDCKTTEASIEKIFYWVQDNIRYIAFEKGIMGFRPMSSETVFDKRYGDCKGMANLLKNMYKEIGLDAHLCWIGTNDIPYDYSTPSLQVDNHMICALKINNKWVFIDGTESYIGLNEYAERIQGKQVLIENGTSYILERIPSSDNSYNKIDVKTSLDIDLTKDLLVGKSNFDLSGEYKTSFFRRLNYSKTDEKDKRVKSTFGFGNNNLNILSYQSINLEDRTKNIALVSNFELSNQITRAGKEVYVGYEIENFFSEFDIDTARLTDVDLDFERVISSNTTIKIPVGYKVDYLPESIKIENDTYGFNINFSNDGSAINYKREIIIKKPILFKKDLLQWNSDIKKLKNKYKDQIVLIQN